MPDYSQIGELHDHTTLGETWYEIDQDCPNCGEPVFSNGDVHKCVGFYDFNDSDCQWWGLPEHHPERQ